MLHRGSPIRVSGGELTIFSGPIPDEEVIFKRFCSNAENPEP